MWRERFAVPYAGTVLARFRGRTAHVTTVLVAPLLLALLALVRIWRPASEPGRRRRGACPRGRHAATGSRRRRLAGTAA